MIRNAQIEKAIPPQRAEGQHRQHFQQVTGREGFPLKAVDACVPFLNSGPLIRDDIDIQVRGQVVEPVHQVFRAAQALLPGAAAQDNFGDAADAGILRNLHRRVIAVGRGDPRAQFLRQMHIVADPFSVIARQGGKFRGLHKQGRKRAVEGPCHPGGGANDLGVGGGAGQADQDVLTGLGLFLSLEPRGGVQPVRRPPQGNFPEEGQVFLGEKIPQGQGRLPLTVDLTLPQPFQQVRRLQVHQLHLVGGVEHAVRDALGHRDTRDGGHLIIQALQMLDIDGGIDIDTRAKQLLDILVALHMAAAPGVGMGQLVHQEKLGLPGQGRVQIEFFQLDPFIGDDLDRQLLQSLQKGHGLRPGVGLDITRHHVDACRLGPVGRLQHGIGLAHAGGIAEKDLQPASRLCFHAADALQQ